MKSSRFRANKRIQPYSDTTVHSGRFGVLLVSVGAMMVMRALAVNYSCSKCKVWLYVHSMNTNHPPQSQTGEHTWGEITLRSTQELMSYSRSSLRGGP